MPVADRVEALLACHSDSVVKLDSRAAREVWRAWGERYPLPRKRAHAILEETVVDRLGAVTGAFTGKHANLLVTATDFAWTLGVSEVSRRSGRYGETVFVEPSA